jgi:ABC-2 type transport system ATP-binding protein
MQEVEAVCNRVIIINHGEIVIDGGINEVKAGNFNKNQKVLAEFSTTVDREKLLSVSGVKNVQLLENLWEIESESESDIRPAIFDFAVKNKLTLLTLQEKQQNLESVFHQLTQE